MASEGQRDKGIIYSPSNVPARRIQSTTSEETRPKTMPYFSKPFQENIPPLCSGESRGLTATDDFQQNRQGMRSTSSVPAHPAAMVVGHSPNHLQRHTRTSEEETRPKATAKIPAKSNPRNTQSTASEETLRKGISALPANTKSSDKSPLLSHHAAAVPPEESTTTSDIPAPRRGRLLRSESIQLGDHNDIYKIAQMTDFKDAKINQVVINNHNYHCNSSRHNGLNKYVKTESDCRIEATNRQCSTNDWDGSAATDGSRCGRRHADDLDQDCCGAMKRHKADLTETTYTKSDCWQEMPQRNHIRTGVSASSAEGWGHNSVNNDSVHSQILSRDSFVQHSSYEKHEVTSEGGRITLQKCSQSIICITDSVKIFDSEGEMVREGDVLFINSEGGYYGVYVGDGGVTFVDVDGLVTTKTVNENLSIPIATEQMDKSASYHRLQPRSRLETSRRAKDLIGQYFPGSGEDFAWFCRYDVPGVPK